MSEIDNFWFNYNFRIDESMETNNLLSQTVNDTYNQIDNFPNKFEDVLKNIPYIKYPVEPSLSG